MVMKMIVIDNLQQNKALGAQDDENTPAGKAFHTR